MPASSAALNASQSAMRFARGFLGNHAIGSPEVSPLVRLRVFVCVVVVRVCVFVVLLLLLLCVLFIVVVVGGQTSKASKCPLALQGGISIVMSSVGV